MTTSMVEFILSIKIGPRQTYKDMTVYCLLAAKQHAIDFTLAKQAIDAGLVRVSEVSESGSVPELKVVNTSKEKVLFMEGEELVGAKQNRILNTTILLAPLSTTVIPVSCVEQGRWSRDRGPDADHMKTRNYAAASLRQKKSASVAMNLMNNLGFMSNQGLVWDEISDRYDAEPDARRSPTASVIDLYEAKAADTDDYAEHFEPVDNQIGLAIFLHDKLAGIEILNNFDCFKSAHPKFIISYALDILDMRSERDAGRRQSRTIMTQRALDALARTPVETRESVSLGKDVRVRSSEILAAGLEYEWSIVQLTAFPTQSEESSRDHGLTRASLRRDFMSRDR